MALPSWLRLRDEIGNQTIEIFIPRLLDLDVEIPEAIAVFVQLFFHGFGGGAGGVVVEGRAVGRCE